MGRKILAVIIGFITAAAIFMVFQMISTMAAPNYPSNAGHISQDEMRAYIATLPPMVFGIVLAGYIVGSFAGGFVASKIGRRWSPGPTLAIIVGAFLTLGGVMNFFVMLPGQPMWFVAASLLSFIPFALVGYRIAR
jgi:MFS family permease